MNKKYLTKLLKGMLIAGTLYFGGCNRQQYLEYKWDKIKVDPQYAWIRCGDRFLEYKDTDSDGEFDMAKYNGTYAEIFPANLTELEYDCAKEIGSLPKEVYP
ncbi:MAG: hypothetical protein PHD81_03910 [Candidatus Nanoarchaeia archaeon]|nr:hypothetical protein [Candidatus Nanoarchaeia archaeon]MDD5588228.1 hypothetical protein [Candidatus Nanoarchaeia archaeon]